MTDTKPSLYSSLVALALLAGLAQAPPARANVLLELSRQMIGSSFEQDRPTALSGSLSTVDAGSARVDRVVGDLVDQEIRQRPLPPPVAAAGRFAPSTVQLIVPVQTGLEFGRIQQLVPTAKILEMGGGVYVLVAETRRAMSAYALGRQLQDRLGFTFQLAYSEGHPDLNMAWMAALDTNRNHAAKPTPAGTTPAAQAAVPPPKPKPAPAVRRGTARDVGLLAQTAPWLTTAEPTPAAPVAPAVPAAVPARSASVQQAAVIEPPPREASASASPRREPERAAVPAPVPTRPVSRAPLASTLTELRSMGRRDGQSDEVQAPATAVASTTPPAADATSDQARASQPAAATSLVPALSSSGQLPTASLVQPVAIRAIALADVPVISGRSMAANQDLAYLYVKVRSHEELLAVNRVAPVAVIHDRDGDLMARVGVFTNSRIGERLRNRRLQQLRNSGYEVELVAGRTGGDAADQA
ncbi:MAG: hypothetical protein RLZZ611_1615 [Cyanobacteriota bacterium]